MGRAQRGKEGLVNTQRGREGSVTLRGAQGEKEGLVMLSTAPEQGGSHRQHPQGSPFPGKAEQSRSSARSRDRADTARSGPGSAVPGRGWLQLSLSPRGAPEQRGSSRWGEGSRAGGATRSTPLSPQPSPAAPIPPPRCYLPQHHHTCHTELPSFGTTIKILRFSPHSAANTTLPPAAAAASRGHGDNDTQVVTIPVSSRGLWGSAGAAFQRRRLFIRQTLIYRPFLTRGLREEKDSRGEGKKKSL